MKTQKKAIDLTDLAIGILILGIVVAIGSRIVVTQRDSRLTDLSTVSVVNETAVPTTAGVDLTYTWGKTITVIYNGTKSVPIAAANYTYSVNPVNGVITLSNTTSDPFTSWLVNYDYYNTSRADWTVANSASVGLGEYGNWFKTIVIVGVAGLVLAIIFMAFGGRGRTSESMGGSY